MALKKENDIEIKKYFTTFDIAQMLGVTMPGVIKWVEKGLIKAEYTPGGHRRIAKEDFMEFLRKNNMKIPKELEKKIYKVFIIDDEQIILNVLKKTFKKYFPDFEVYLYKSSIDALIEAKEKFPDFIILDIIMPEMDGKEMIKKIKQYPMLKNIPIIAMSGKIDLNEQKKILENGADFFINKPFDLKELVKIINILVERK